MPDLKLVPKNIFSNYGMYIARMLTGLLTLPACLNAYGQEMYGLYLICFGLSSSMASFDFGGSKSIFRYVVEHENDKNISKFATALSVGITFNIMASILIVALLILTGIYSDILFNLTPDVQNIAPQLFTLAAINSAILTISTVPINILNGNNCFHSRNVLQFIPLCATFSLVIYLHINNTFPLLYFSTVMIGISLLSLLLDLYLVKTKKFIKNIPIRLILNRSLFQTKNLEYNYRVFLLSLVSFLAVQADKLVIALFFNVSSVSIYAIITKPYFLLKGFLGITYPVIQPQLSKLNIEKNRVDFNEFSSKVVKGSFLIFLLGISFLGIFFEDALWLWLKTTEYNIYIIWGVISMLTLAITTLYGPYYRTLLYTDGIKNILKFSYLSVTINLIISIILTSMIGFSGVIIGTLIQILMELFYTNYLASKKLHAKFKLIYERKTIISAVCIIIYSILAYNLKQYYVDSISFPNFLAVATILIYMGYLYYFVRKEKLHLIFSGKKEAMIS